MDPRTGGGGDPPDGDIQDMEILPYSDDEDDSSTITPTPRLTLGSVFEILPTLKSGIVSIKFNVSMIAFTVTTPNINNQLALPYKKRPVETSSTFKTVWSGQKEYLRKVGGKGGLYKENKEKRKSESFPWPDSPNMSGNPTMIISSTATSLSNTSFTRSESAGISVSSSSSTSMTPSTQSDLTMSTTSNNPSMKTPPLEQHFLVKLDVLKRRLVAANVKIEELEAKVDDLHLQGCDKDAQIRSLRKKNQDLQRVVIARG